MAEQESCRDMQQSLDHRIMDRFIQTGKGHRSALERRLQETGVYRGQHRLLMCISKHPDLSQKELAELEDVSTAAIAVSLKKLEKGGYVERVVDAKDNRSNNIRITEKGQNVVRQSIHIFQDVEKQTFADFSEEEKLQFLGFLERACKNIRQSGCENAVKQETDSETESED